MRKQNLPQPFQIGKVRFEDCFTAPSPSGNGIRITPYGQETIVSLYRFEAIRYKAAGNEPLSIVMVRVPGEHSNDVKFCTQRFPSQHESHEKAKL
jgi:hypothetical protein